MHASAVVPAYTSGLSIRAIAASSSLSRAEVSTILAEAGVAMCGEPVLDLSPAQWALYCRRPGPCANWPGVCNANPVTIYNHLRRHSVTLPTGAAAIGTSAWWDERTERVGECEVWNRAHTVDGFARTSRDGQQLHAHRVRWQEQHGEVPSGYEILHISPRIRKDYVRLDHLRAQPVITRLAVQAQDGVFPRGEQHWNSKLEEEQARSILVSRAPTTVLARRFHVSRATVIATARGTDGDTSPGSNDAAGPSEAAHAAGGGPVPTGTRDDTGPKSVRVAAPDQQHPPDSCHRGVSLRGEVEGVED